MKAKTKIWIAALLLAVILLTQCATSTYNNSVTLYNKCISFEAEYVKKTRQQVSVYDANYLAFVEKSKIANINKETFINITDIIMQNRKDGENLAWKWVTENQHIPYNEFTYFYRELSTFISNQYHAFSSIEAEKQEIAASQNVLIKTYPNNIYNLYLKIKPLEYRFGYISDSTRKLFKL